MSSELLDKPLHVRNPRDKGLRAKRVWHRILAFFNGRRESFFLHLSGGLIEDGRFGLFVNILQFSFLHLFFTNVLE